MRKKTRITVYIGFFCLLLLMVDPTTALSGATNGIRQVLQVIIPSLFPYFFISTYLNTNLLGMHIPGIRFIANKLHIPKGGDSLLLLGIIGGYPVGAQAIASTYKDGAISKNCAQILLGYCNNAGPAFIFGVTASLFPESYMAWLLWLIQILSTLITAHFLPRPNDQHIIWRNIRNITIIHTLQRSIRSMVSVCGWIILFKILIAYITKPLLSLDNNVLTLLSGLLELSNGCLSLSEISRHSVRFILCSIFLSFGGLCVLMQTKSTTESMGLGLYLPGKLIQTSISFLLSVVLSAVLFQDEVLNSYWLILGIIVSLLIILYIKIIVKNNCGKIS